jgi:hypothetical protein
MLTDAEREIIKTVVRRFRNMKESTPRTLLVKRFKDPDAVDHLVKATVLRTHDGAANLWPMALAFEYCEDVDIQRLAKRSVEVVLQVLQNLFEVEMEKTDFTAADVETHARKMFDTIDPETVNLGLYLAQEFAGVFSGFSVNAKQEFVSLRISERIVRLRGFDSLWDEHIRQYSANLRREETFEMENQTERTPFGEEQIAVLISHSSRDKELAEALIELLRSGLGLLASQIRCSSVDGYRLPAGVNTDAHLRREIKSARVLIGLLTHNSLSSTYVLFELGARWGAELFMIPLLAGTKPEEMRGPHRVLNAMSCETDEQLIQLVEDIGKELDINPQSASSYLKQLRIVKALAESISVSSQTPSPAPRQPSLTSAYGVAKPQLIFLNTHAVRLRVGDYEGEGFYESKDLADPYGVVACFRNESSPGQRVVGADNVRAQVIYRDSNGVEIGEGVPRACWEGHKYDLIDFPVGQSHCAILMMVFNDGRLLVPWKERSRAGSWMGGDTITTRDSEFSKDAVALIEIRLIGETNDLLLPPLTFDFSIIEGKPCATLRHQ